MNSDQDNEIDDGVYELQENAEDFEDYKMDGYHPV